MIYKWGTFNPFVTPYPKGPVRSVMVPDRVFTREGVPWSDNVGNKYTNFGAVLYDWPGGVEDVPEADPVVESIKRLRDNDWHLSPDGRIVLDWAEKNHPGMNNA